MRRWVAASVGKDLGTVSEVLHLVAQSLQTGRAGCLRSSKLLGNAPKSSHMCQLWA
jgi:hypothetical protein